MKRLACVLAVAAVVRPAPAGAAEGDGMITARSPVAVPALIDRVEAFVTAHGAAVVARIDHAAAGAKVGLPLRPTTLLVFGNPRIGTPLMQCDQRAGIELPLKALAWQDAAGQAWLGVTDPAAFATRYRLGPGCDAAVTAAASAMHALVEAATKP